MALSDTIFLLNSFLFDLCDADCRITSWGLEVQVWRKIQEYQTVRPSCFQKSQLSKIRKPKSLSVVARDYSLRIILERLLLVLPVKCKVYNIWEYNIFFSDLSKCAHIHCSRYTLVFFIRFLVRSIVFYPLLLHALLYNHANCFQLTKKYINFQLNFINLHSN